MSPDLERFDPNAVHSHAADAWTPTTPTVHAHDFNQLLALYEITRNRADSAQKKLQQLEAEVSDPNFYLRALNCPHEIDAQKVVLHFDPRQEGHNALNQLSRRLTPPKQKVEPSQPLGGRLPPPERQQLWVLIDETLGDTLGPLERGDICNLLAPVLAPLVSKPEAPGLIKADTLLASVPWMDTPLNLDEIKLNAERYLYLRDHATNSTVLAPMVVLVNPKPDYVLGVNNDVADSLRYGRQLDHYVDRFLFPKKDADQS